MALFLLGLLEELPLGASRGKRKKVSRVKTSETQVPGEVTTLQKDACVGCRIVWALDTGIANNDKEFGALKQSHWFGETMQAWALSSNQERQKNRWVSQVLWVSPKHQKLNPGIEDMGVNE